MSPSNAKWYAMVKKHHAWKLVDYPDVCLYGEDIFGVHSIEYGSVREEETFYAFAMRVGTRWVNYDDLVAFCRELDIPVVPLLYRGVFETWSDLDAYIGDEMCKESVLGGCREGVVIGVDFPGSCSFEYYTQSRAKVVRPNHVQTDEHWSQHWKPCRLEVR